MEVASVCDIAERTACCLEMFRRLSFASDFENGDSLSRGFRDQLDRFKLWAFNIDVFAEVQLSLDFRVRELPEVKRLFMRHLRTIESRLALISKIFVQNEREQYGKHIDRGSILSRGKASMVLDGETRRLGAVEGFPEGQGINETMRESFGMSESSSEGLAPAPESAAKRNDHEASNNLTEAVPELDLGSARNSSTPLPATWTPTEVLESIHGSIDWLHRLSNFVESTGFDSQKHRAESTVVPHLEGQRSFFEHIIARELNCFEEHPMSKRLVDTMIKRRKLYLFRDGQTYSWTTRNTNNEQQRRKERHTQTMSSYKMSGKVPMTRSPSRSTKLAPPGHRRQAATFRISSIPTSASFREDEQTLIPPLPERIADTGELECPYCRLILQDRDIATHAAWSLHVMSDLEPYICIYSECSEEDRLYASLEQWLAHMSNEHRMGWGCYATAHDPLPFDTVKEFEEHMKNVHKGTFPDSDLALMAEINRRPIHPIIEKCPFCKETAGTNPNLPEHVGQHLRICALYSLPWPDGAGQDGDDTNVGARYTDVTWPSNGDFVTTTTFSPPTSAVEDFDHDCITWDLRKDLIASSDNNLLGRPSEWGGLGLLGTKIEAQHQPLQESEVHRDEHLEAFYKHTEQPVISETTTDRIGTMSIDQNTDQFVIELGSTDLRNDKAHIEQMKGGLRWDSYCWVFDNIDYKKWLSDGSSRLLWIRGDSDTGKTMLLCGIICEFEKQPTTNACYFFCQSINSHKNNATAVLRGLVCMLVDHQQSLISHVREKCGSAGKQLFEDANAWDSLTAILDSILKDAHLNTTYLVIDALDECTTGQPQLLDLIIQMSTAYPTSKWIVSSRNRPEIEEKLENYSGLIVLRRLGMDSIRPKSLVDSSMSEAATAEPVEDASIYTDWPLDLTPSFGSHAIEIDAVHGEASGTLTNETFNASSSEALAYCQMIRRRFNSLPKCLVERLAEANVVRSETLRQAKAQWTTRQNQPTTRTHDEVGEGLVATGEHQLTDASDSFSAFSKPTSTVESGHTSDSSDKASESTFVSFATSFTSSFSTGSLRPRVPQMPQVQNHESGFYCSVCFEYIMKPLVATRRDWMRHVFEDLKPYMCMIEDCQDNSTLYAHSGAWASHQSSHSVSSSSHEPLTCVFCSGRYKNAESYYRHVSGHLKEVSLSVLPQAANEDDLDDEPSDDKLVPTEEKHLDINADMSIGSRAMGLESIEEHLQKQMDNKDPDPALEQKLNSAFGLADAETGHDNAIVSQPAGTGYLETKLLAARRDSKEPFGGKFWPEGSLRNVFTEDSVKSFHLDPELVQYILREAKKLFALCLLIGIKQPELGMTMTIFRKHDFCDSSLPISADFLNSILGERLPWGPVRKDSFMHAQWQFLAPIFPLQTKRAPLHILGDTILPFVEVEKATKQGSFGTIYKVRVHSSHFDQSDPVQQARCKVAIKEIDLIAERAAFRRELMASMHIMRPDVQQDPSMRHMANVKAIFQQSEKMYFMLPWADGGNLWEFWAVHRGQPRARGSFIEGITTQLLGLSEALTSIHKQELRHGDLKPENILVYHNEGRSDTWKISDLGLARLHAQLTQERSQTSPRSMILYEPPEFQFQGNFRAVSRLYDTWSMGCIILQLITWLLYGIEGVENLTDKICNQANGERAFWSRHKAEDGQGIQMIVRKDVQEHMEKIMGDPIESQAIKDLLKVVRDKLLVIRLPSSSTEESSPGFRANAEILRDNLMEIHERGTGDSKYWHTSGLLFRVPRNNSAAKDPLNRTIPGVS